MNNERVIVGMSGGVDSSVSAYLLQQAGYDVHGMFMKNWEDDDSSTHCTATEDLADAQRVCDTLGIVLHQVNFAAEYKESVFSHFLTEYQAGRTPNPDILCNKEIKFKVFLDYAQRLGGRYIATGHYVRAEQHGNRIALLKGLDPSKDQSYFLHALNQQQLGPSLFPVGALPKSEVRLLATHIGLHNAERKDSTGICFIGERDFKEFLERYVPRQRGDIVSVEGQVVGTHDGLAYYTIGQRQGLGIGGLRGADAAPWYVVDKDMAQNRLIVCQGHDHPAMQHNHLIAGNAHWISGEPPPFPLHCHAKTRYRQADQACTVSADNHSQLHVHFTHPQRAITPGQSVVFYQGEICLGGAIIQSRDYVTT